MSKCKFTIDLVKLKLLENHCLPIILYVMDCLNLKEHVIKELNSQWNAIYRKIFNFNKWESVKTLICSLQRLDFKYIINMRRVTFVKRMSMSGCNNDTFTHILHYFLNRGDFVTLISKYNSKFTWSLQKIKAMYFVNFRAEAMVG